MNDALDTSYWGTHTRIIIRLQELGYRYRLYDRLPIFKLWLELLRKGRKHPKLQPHIQRILNDLDLLRALRAEGLEPELLDKNRYKPGS